ITHWVRRRCTSLFPSVGITRALVRALTGGAWPITMIAAMEDAAMPFVTAKDGVKLHYALHDYTDPWHDAPILILQHGYGRSERFWFSLIPYLTRFYRVVCPDLRGLGQSSKDFDLAAGISVENYLSDLLVIADSLGV